MPAFLIPGYQVKVSNPKSSTTDETTILGLHAPDILQVSSCRLELNPGDNIKLEVPRRGKGLCVFKAKVMEGDSSEGHLLHLSGKPKLLQRRRSRRRSVYHRAEYILTAAKTNNEDFRAGLILNISRDGALLATKESFTLFEEIFLIFEINLHTLTGENVVPTGIGGKVVRKHSILKADTSEEDTGVWEWSYSYGISFDKPFVALKR